METNYYTIRQETKNDYDGIYKLIQTAFQTAKVKDGDEQDFAVQLRNSENYIPELALVAEQEGKLIGHIMFTKTVVKQPDGKAFHALLVAPLSVLNEYRNTGVGSALMKKGLDVAKKMGYKAVFLCGDPGYYNRFGFTQTSNYGIKAQRVPDQYVLVYELCPNALKGVSGVVECC